MISRTKAFVFINCRTGAEGGLLQKLKEMESVSEAYIVYGFYDLLAVLKAESSEEIKDIVQSKIRKFENVTSTVTMIATAEQF